MRVYKVNTTESVRSCPMCARANGFTIVELITVIILLGILSIVALAKFVEPSAYAPSIVTHGLVAEGRMAQQIAVSRVDAVVSLTLDKLGDDWRVQVSTDVDGVLRNNLFEAENTTLQASSGAAIATLDATTQLLVTYAHSGDLSGVQIGASAGDAAMGVELALSGDSNRQICIYPSGYTSDDACS